MKVGGASLLLIGSLFGGDAHGYSRATSASELKPRKQTETRTSFSVRLLERCPSC
jgi:hypothetical protein